MLAEGGGDAPGLRAVATTASPAASAALAMSTPMPRPAPVMSQTFLSLMWVNFFLVDVPHPASSAVALSTQPASAARWQTLMRGVLAGTPSQAGPLVQWQTWQARRDPAGVRGEIRAFLSTRRARISPAQAGLPVYGESTGGSRACAARRSPSPVATFGWKGGASSTGGLAIADEVVVNHDVAQATADVAGIVDGYRLAARMGERPVRGTAGAPDATPDAAPDDRPEGS